jgi:hypothetical protein
MMRTATLWFTLAGLLTATSASAQAPETPPRPELNPARSALSNSAMHAPPPKKKPNISGEQPSAEKIDPRIAAAHAKCAELLEDAVLSYQRLPPIRGRACGTTAPILVKSIGVDPAVVISPPATMNCTLAAALYTWLENTVQPAAAVLGASVVKIRNALSYECRRRYDGTNTKISEHAFANALDISEFVFSSGQRITVLKGWPLGARKATLPLAPTLPLPNPQRVVAPSAAHAAASSETTGAIVAVRSAHSMGSAIVAAAKVRTNPFARLRHPFVAQLPQSPLPHSSSIQRSEGRATAWSDHFFSPLPVPGAELSALGTRRNVKDQETKTEPSARPLTRKLESQEVGAFVRSIHADACSVFETVLGPHANAAHRDHFHLDMKKRRYVKICE